LQVNFGSIIFPSNVSVPADVIMGQFKQLQHGVRSGDVTILDKKRIHIMGMYYDGQGPGMLCNHHVIITHFILDSNEIALSQ
jgi:hypothetical protein